MCYFIAIPECKLLLKNVIYFIYTDTNFSVYVSPEPISFNMLQLSS